MNLNQHEKYKRQTKTFLCSNGYCDKPIIIKLRNNGVTKIMSKNFLLIFMYTISLYTTSSLSTNHPVYLYF